MSHASLQEPAASEPASRLPQVALALAAGTLVASRPRVGGAALLLAGLAWVAAKKVTGRKTAADAEAEVSRRAENQSPLPVLTEEVLPPSAPFASPELPRDEWERLRAELQPPAHLFNPAPPQLAVSPQAPWLHSAPVIVAVEEAAPPTPLAEAAQGAVLPDTITIPATPDPPPDLLAGQDPPVVEKTEPPRPARRSFLQWMRE